MTGQLSVMIGDQATGLAGFVATAKPRGLYCLNNRVRGTWPQLMTVFRVQNKADGKRDGWDRLPDACNTQAYWVHTDPVVSARYELLQKTTYVPKVGALNLIAYWKLSNESWYAPVNEPDLGQGDDRFARAQWWAAWFMEALNIARAAGVPLCLGSFPTGGPALDTLPIFAPVFELLKLAGGIIDVHEYGVDGFLMESGHRSGALRYREFYNALPPASRCDMVISEFWAWSGFTLEGNWRAQVEDAAAYGRELLKDPYVLWASAFQLNQRAESHLVPQALTYYAQLASGLLGGPEPRYVLTTQAMSEAQSQSVQLYLQQQSIGYSVAQA